MQLGKGTVHSAMVGVRVPLHSRCLRQTPTPTTSDLLNVTRIFGCEMEVPIAMENGGVIQPPEKMAAKD